MRKHIFADILLFAASVAAAWAIVHWDITSVFLHWTGDSIVVASFVAGLFFTSLFTTAPAVAILAELALTGNMLGVALVGAFGAMVGDSILFLFVRERIAKDAEYVLRGSRLGKLVGIIQHSHFRRVLPVVGALIIASPLPDEFGLALLWVSDISTKNFLILSYCMNFVGIILLCLLVRGAA